MIITYSEADLILILQEFYKNKGFTPKASELKKYNLPSHYNFVKIFNSYNEALSRAGLPLNRINDHSNCKCICCGTTESKEWRRQGTICRNCHDYSRYYLHGFSDPNTSTGMGIITEHAVFEVLGDCIKCNVPGTFGHPYDLISESLGTINVKSSKLCKSNKGSSYWQFSMNPTSIVPDFYICLGLNEDRTEILKVWAFEGDNTIIPLTGIKVTNSVNGLASVKEYEIDPVLFNEIYKNIKLTDLPEFRNWELINNVNEFALQLYDTKCHNSTFTKIMLTSTVK